MKVGDLVSYNSASNTSEFQDATGLVVEILGRKWIKVKWSDNVIHSEHLDDLKRINSTTK